MPVVLVVDDDPLIRMDIVASFEDAGCRAIEAGNSVEAIKRLTDDDAVDLVFTDVQMPGSMDGVALANYVRGHWPRIHIVVSSGARLVDYRELPENAHFLAKPIDPGRLGQIAADFCKQAAAE